MLSSQTQHHYSFLLYINVFQKRVFFLNDRRKLGFIKQYLFEKLNKQIDVKTIYASIDEFTNKIKTIEKIKFTGFRDLFSSQNDIFKGFKDVFAYGEPESFSISANYSQTINSKITEMLKNFDTANKSYLIRSLVCIGKDEKGFESVFNSDSFSQKLEISLDKNEENLFNQDEVKKLLIETIGI